MKKKVSRKWRNWYQNEVDKVIKGVCSKDKVKHNKRSDQLFFREDDVGGRATVMMDGRASTSRMLNRHEVMNVLRLGSCDNFVGKFRF